VNNPKGEKPPGNESKLIIAARVSGVTILDLRSVAVWNASDTFLYESGQIDGKKFNGHDFPLDVNNEVDDYGYVLAGVNNIEDLAADNVVYIYKNADKKIARIEVGTETQSGTVTNVNLVDKQRTIGGKVLGMAPYSGHNIVDANTPGNEGTALLDIYSRIYDFQLGEASKGNFAVFLADQASFNAMQAKIFDKTGSEVIYSVKADLENYTGDTLDGVRYWDSKTSTAGGKIGTESLIGYKISGGKLAEATGSRSMAANSKAKVNKSGTILTIGTTNYLIDGNALVYVNNGDGDYSLGSVKDLVDKEIEQKFQYYFDGTDNKVKAFLVESSDAGAQNVFVMINSISTGWNNGDVHVVSGFSFADGANAAKKSWDFADNTLIGKLSGMGYGAVPYKSIFKFRIGDDGILKSVTDVSTIFDDKDGDKDKEDGEINPTVTGAVFLQWNPGPNGTFSIDFTTTSGAVNVDTISSPIAFEADAVLYKPDGTGWTAMRPTEGNFKADDGKGVYTFLKTDLTKAYDIIIKTN
jgi:hypothetical protein